MHNGGILSTSTYIYTSRNSRYPNFIYQKIFFSFDMQRRRRQRRFVCVNIECRRVCHSANSINSTLYAWLLLEWFLFIQRETNGMLFVVAHKPCSTFDNNCSVSFGVCFSHSICACGFYELRSCCYGTYTYCIDTNLYHSIGNGEMGLWWRQK